MNTQIFIETKTKKEEIIKLGYSYIEIWENDWLIFVKKIKIIQKLWKSKLY